LLIALILSITSIGFVEAQDTKNADNFDNLVNTAILLSESAIYKANFDEASKYIQPSYFEQFNTFSDRHKIQLLIQQIRIQGFRNILFQSGSDSSEVHKGLLQLLSVAENLKDKNVIADYFRQFSESYRSTGNEDSASLYEKKALEIFNEIGNLGKVAEIRANQISRIHNDFQRKGEKEKILALIPKYKEEIIYSTPHSKYALAYNTRHLAQIHLKQTLNYQEALKLFEKSLSLRVEIGFKPFIPASYFSIGEVYSAMGNYEASIQMFKKSAETAEEMGFIRYQFSPNIQIGDIYLKKGNKELAKEFYQKALTSASKNNDSSGTKEALQKIKLVTN
jgi:tetratricopeptide (TPR) repeat protein